MFLRVFNLLKYNIDLGGRLLMNSGNKPEYQYLIIRHLFKTMAIGFAIRANSLFISSPQMICSAFYYLFFNIYYLLLIEP